MQEVGVIRNWDFNLLMDIEDTYCEFVGACPAFPAAAGREQQVTPLRLHENTRGAARQSCAAHARISPEANSVPCRSTPGDETA